MGGPRSMLGEGAPMSAWPGGGCPPCGGGIIMEGGGPPACGGIPKGGGMPGGGWMERMACASGWMACTSARVSF